MEKNGLSLDCGRKPDNCRTCKMCTAQVYLHLSVCCIYLKTQLSISFTLQYSTDFYFTHEACVSKVVIITVVLVLREKRSSAQNSCIHSTVICPEAFIKTPFLRSAERFWVVPVLCQKMLPPAISLSYFYQLSSLLSPRGFILEYELTYRLK